ncbi:MAG: hypothetical protein ABUT20_50770, partial [Bacteroidota bacterium]
LKRENDICSAKVTAIDHPYHQFYRVQFDDGYENIFFTDVETGNWIEEDLGETFLAGSFGSKIYLLNGNCTRPCKTLAWCKASVANKIISFGFFTYLDDTEIVFEVFGDNHKFLYTFRNNNKDGWEVFDAHHFIKSEQYNEQIKIIISVFKGLKGCPWL